MKNSKTRKEEDALGKVTVPAEAYFGAFTIRAQKNFQISKLNAPKTFKEALGTIKLAAAESNHRLKLLSKKEFSAIEKAAKEFIAGKFDKEFNLDVFQAGAGTSYNMNANEIIANRANELLKGKKGEYKHIHPNNHVNLGQSTNDVIPAATRIAILFALPDLLKAITELEEEIGKKQKKYKDLIKVGRTHLQDAVPITFGQEFDSFREAFKKSRDYIAQLSEQLQILGIGGTAVGTGINTDPNYKKHIFKNLKKLTGIEFYKAKNATEIANNMNSFMNFSSGLRSLATDLINFSSNLQLMNSGPKAGIGEIDLPEVQPGSSIMPGKINPSILEAVTMTCLHVLGNDKTVELAAQRSLFELNVLCPLIMFEILQSMELLTNIIHTLNNFCIKNLKVNTDRTKTLLDKSLCNATALVPYIGYSKTAKIVKSTLKKSTRIKQELIDQKIFTEKEINELFSADLTTKPSKIRKKLKK